MPKSSQTRRPLRTVAILLAVLAITTGWVEAAVPRGSATLGDAARSMQAIALAAHRLDRPVQPVSQALTLDRAADAALAAEARSLYRARALVGPPSIKVAVAPVAKAAPVKTKPPVVKATAKTYSGRNHFWFPKLGISRPVYSFPCTRTREPDNYVYRWGCAGRNNVYLLGHAWGVFKPLHDAYLSGRLRVGMIAVYADGNGHVRQYRVTTWRVVKPTDSEWAIASQPVASMTLQTCVGLNRLNVRLVAVN